MPRRAQRFVRLAVLCLLGGLPCACHQDMFKATPFAAGEHPETIGSPAGRLNLWPLLYHRKPATSFLWPLGEVTDTTWAVRPLVASYENQLDVLWPVSHFNFERGTGYVLPSVYWGEDWFFLFPLYGHHLPDAGERGWIYTPLYFHGFTREDRIGIVPPLFSWWHTSPDHSSLQVVLSLYGQRRGPGHSSEHIFPLYWRQSDENAPDGPRGHLVLFPFYFGVQRQVGGVPRNLHILPPLLSGWGNDWAFCPLYGQRREEGGSSGWTYSPLYFHRYSASERYTLLPPLLTWWRHDADGHEVHVVWNIYGHSRHTSHAAEHLFPLYWRSRDARLEGEARSHLVLFPFYLGFERQVDGVERKLRIVPPLLGGWSDTGALFLLYGRSVSPGGDAGWLYTPLYFHRYTGSDRLSVLPPLFTWWRTEAEASEVTVALGLYGRSRRGQSASEHLFPFYWRGTSASADGGARDYLVLFPFYGRSRRQETGESWVFTPLHVRRSTAQGQVTVVPPLLSWWKADAEGADAHLALSLYGQSRRADYSAEHLFPLYWRGVDERESSNRRRHLVLFPLYMGFDWRQTESGDRSLRILPLLLGGWGETRTEERTERTTLFPLLYASHEIRDADGSEEHEVTRVLPPLLSLWHRRQDGSQNWHLLLSLVAWGGTRNDSFSRALPFYYHSRQADSRSFGIPALLYFSQWSEASQSQVFFPLVGYTRRGLDLTVNFLFPLGRVRRTAEVDSESFFPLFSREHRKLASRWERAEDGESQGRWRLVPTDEREFHILYILFDKFERPTEEGERYCRTRVLWRLWHDEEVGENRSLDVFPFFTFDQSGEESLSWSWIYRLIRYERKGEARALNLFFLPAIRWGGE